MLQRDRLTGKVLPREFRPSHRKSGQATVNLQLYRVHNGRRVYKSVTVGEEDVPALARGESVQIYGYHFWREGGAHELG